MVVALCSTMDYRLPVLVFSYTWKNLLWNWLGHPQLQMMLAKLLLEAWSAFSVVPFIPVHKV